MKTRAFTLIEMLIVITIVGILMAITMKFGGNFIRDVEARQTREEWLSDFSILRSKLLLSSHFDGEPRKSVIVSFEDKMMKTQFPKGDGESVTNCAKPFIYKNMTIDWPTITITPYEIACKKSDNKKKIQLSFPHTQPYCYSIDAGTCKLQAAQCNWE